VAAPVLTVERYVLCEPIAVGGMATVYFARQRGAGGFSKAVAIKRMRPDLVHQREFVDLFVDEARLASRVRHANVVSVIDVVASGDELLLVMEYFHGESLSRLLRACAFAKKRVPPAIAVALVCNVLHGLHAAHEAKGEKGEPLGIVHRDVSPQNVIVGVDGVARVADFGIARAAGQIHATDEGKTRGKAGYSAPEQLRGGPVTRKIDLFAACVLLWEILVGRRLFEGESQAAVITAVLTEPIEAPGLYAPELPGELDDVILRGLDRDPKRRPETALELAAALARAVAPAGPALVSAWVIDLAGEDLEKREEVVRRIEAGLDEASADAPALVAVPAPSSSSTTAGASASGEAQGPLADAAADPLGTGSLATSRSPSEAPPSRRSRALPIALGVAALALAALAGASIVARPTTIGSPPALPSTSPSVARPEAPTAAVPSSPEVVPVAAPSASGVVRLPQRPSPTLPLRASVAHPVSAPSRPKSKRCEPPYDLDPAGRKIFRVECLE
jgi:eukaryotic-like serine/threonine-protein kinase